VTDQIVDFSDVGDASSAPDGSTPNRRGRPRSPETIARDDQVVRLLETGPKTKAQLVTELGIPPQRVYLSLWRLRRQGHVERVVSGADRHTWRLRA
jgi:predicted Rossmann fold nucleotide-binding protein DprA/Smf involved in DNA uptake